MNLNSLIHFYESGATFLALVIALGYSLSKEKQPLKSILSFLYLSLFFLLLSTSVLPDRRIYSYPFLFSLHLPFLFAIGPLLYLLSIYLADKEKVNSKVHLFYFLPMLPATLVLIYIQMSSEAYKLQLIDNIYTREQVTPAALVLFLSLVYLGFFLVRSLYLFYFLFTKNLLRNEESARILFTVVLISFFTWSFSILSILTNHLLLVQINVLLLSTLVVFSFFLQFKYPNFLKDLDDVVRKEKYKRTLLSHLDLEDLEMKLKKLLEEEKIYRDDEISLQSLAIELNLNPHQLSEYLNQNLGLNFFSLIHKHRIQEAKDLLSSDPDSTILSIAYRVGFNSKSSFHTAFLKDTGMSPSEFRKKVRIDKYKRKN